MTPVFSVRITARFVRSFKKLARRHADLAARLAASTAILQTDPYNRGRFHPIKKVVGVHAGEGQYRIRSGRFRFRYDVEDQIVYLIACGLRREGTYRR